MYSPQKRRIPHANHTVIKYGKSGMTLLELTVVILVLIALIATLFIGAKAWKRGSDRAICIILIHNVQKGIRSFSNLNGYTAGDNATNLQSQVMGLGRFVESTPECPADGIYTFGATFGNNTIPPHGSLYMECSLNVSNEHQPVEFSDW